MAKKARGASPTHKLSILDKTTDHRGVVGVGWVDQATGAVTIKLNAHVVLSEVGIRGCVLTLFPSDYDLSTERTMGPPAGDESTS